MYILSSTPLHQISVSVQLFLHPKACLALPFQLNLNVCTDTLVHTHKHTNLINLPSELPVYPAEVLYY